MLLLTLGGFAAPGLTLVARAATAVRVSEEPVRCHAVPGPPEPPPPGRPDAVVHQVALRLALAGVDGVREIGLDCDDDVDVLRPLDVADAPADAGAAGRSTGPSGCSVRPAGAGVGDAVKLVLVNDAGTRRELAVSCPAGASIDRPLRITYHPHDVGARSRADMAREDPDSPVPGFVLGGLLLAVAGFFVGAVVHAWRTTARVYVVSPLGTPLAPPPPEPVDPADVPRPEPATTFGPTGPGSTFYAAVPGVMLAAVGLVGAGLLASASAPAGIASALVVVVVVVLLIRWLARAGREDGMVVTVGDDALILTSPAGLAWVVTRSATGLVGISVTSGGSTTSSTTSRSGAPPGSSSSAGTPHGRSAGRPGRCDAPSSGTGGRRPS